MITDMVCLTPTSFINNGYHALRITEPEYSRFVKALSDLFEKTNVNQTEEEQKNHFLDFLKSTFHKDYYISPEKTMDIAVHNGKSRQSKIGLIIEMKSIGNKGEMVTRTNLNRKAMQELLLYYLRERISNRNTDLRHLLITNINEIFIFDAREFERKFYGNKRLIEEFLDYERGAKSITTTKSFYSEVASKYIEEVAGDLQFTHIPLHEYKRFLATSADVKSRKITELCKALSAVRLLKLPFQNDSNSLNRRFYNELLHIIGIEEKKQGNKILIVRKTPGNRQESSMIEATIAQLDSMNCVFNVEAERYGNDYEEQLFNIALELCITWVNRILFLKLLEAQSVKYHGGDKHFSFLREDRIKCYNDFNTLFFRVVACDYENRTEAIAWDFSFVPYLNSSLFEVTELERKTLKIGNLTVRKPMTLYADSVLRGKNRAEKSDSISPTEYILSFLDAYDFGGDDEEPKKDGKTLINASVLGLIFEKINGHKEGAVFTPGFITMYMCREAITQAVVDKFNDYYGWTLRSYDELLNKDLDIEEGNAIINSIRICDPAVGSGHFLVSALNEILRIKFELGILADSNGKRIKSQDYTITIDNDELVIVNSDGSPFVYHRAIKESRRVQETLFNEKLFVIENCLFGVDINQNSVNISRLRLWIELLKNTYFTKESNFRYLKTLPNIDTNIMQGNSLIRRFPLNSTLDHVLKSSGVSIPDYKEIVASYKATSDKQLKHTIELVIKGIKAKLGQGIQAQDPRRFRLKHLKAKLFLDEHPIDFEFSEDVKASRLLKKRIAETKKEIAEIERELRKQSIESSDNTPFEWRFEFPEILDNDGKFMGFDLIIGNPPYIQLQSMKKNTDLLEKIKYQTFLRTGDIYCLFYEMGIKLLKDNGILSFITSNKWMKADYGANLRLWITENTDPVSLIDFGDCQIFDGVSVGTNILTLKKRRNNLSTQSCFIPNKETARDITGYVVANSHPQAFSGNAPWSILSPLENGIRRKIETIGKPLEKYEIQINLGIKTGYNDAFIISSDIRNEILKDCENDDERCRTEDLIRPVIRGRDIKPYQVDWADKWLINTHNGVKGSIPRIEIEEYPAVKKYLDTYIDKISTRTDKGDTPYNLRNCAYLDEFGKDKLVWLTITDKPKFAFDHSGAFTLNSSYIMTGDNLEPILVCLNSRLIEWYFSLICSSTGEGTNKWEKFAVNQIPIVELSTDTETIKRLITDKDFKALDRIVMDSYGLTEEEQDHILRITGET